MDTRTVKAYDALDTLRSYLKSDDAEYGQWITPEAVSAWLAIAAAVETRDEQIREAARWLK